MILAGIDRPRLAPARISTFADKFIVQVFGNRLGQRLFVLVSFIHGISPYRVFRFLVDQTHAGRFRALNSSAVGEQAARDFAARAFRLAIHRSCFHE